MTREQLPATDVHDQRDLLDSVRLDCIPQTMRAYRQWVCWVYADSGRDTKPAKRPLNPKNLHNAGVNWRNTWGTFEQVCDVYAAHGGKGISGIGFVLTANDPFVGVDIDDCIEDGRLMPEAENVVIMLQSYTEVSPSGAGLRILVECPQFGDNMRRPGLEVYAHSRFLTLTGHHLPHTPNTRATVTSHQITSLLPERSVAAVEECSQSPGRKSESVWPDADDLELWERIFEHDRYGAQHRQRFAGDTSLDANDHSLCVVRLLNALARWTRCDDAKMRAMMLASPLSNEKWWSTRGHQDWLDYQIADAICYVGNKTTTAP